MIYRPYKNMSCGRKAVRYLSNQNVLMRMSNFTLLSMFTTVTLFLALLSYTLYNDRDYTRLMHAVTVDVFLNLINIYLNLKDSDSPTQKIHEFVPESFRALSVLFYYIFVYRQRDRVYVYLTLVYAVPVLYRLVGWTRYAKTKFFGASSCNLGTD